ncbi:MAG: hypothetical protein E7272_12720 [Pseudobutyrivibrio ruminis]|uniref:Uncharacterized protein n=1 Tax=Pseudobutyrivibrio ruminis TaxID=46206 RepID=A0A927YNY7_9FIRM|nr:hypothetical protein [Pseudobutyrivibrio ruminis]
MRKIRNTKKVNRTFKAMNVSEFKMECHISNLPKCPYCGGSMKLTTKPDFNNEMRTYLECKNNDALHDVRCQVIKLDNNYLRLTSTPADKRLRILRQQAHWYMNLLIKNKLFTDILDIYAYLNDRTLLGSGRRETSELMLASGNSLASIGTGRINHIGEMQQFGCQEVIRECIKLLYKNRDKLIFRWRYGNPVYETPDLSLMLDEIVAGRKFNEEKIAC